VLADTYWKHRTSTISRDSNYCTVIGTVFVPHGVENTTLPLLFLTLTVKLTMLVPETLFETGET